jgi:ppGpp synthetase/RelA/SpoT-type nucleotidyltranferase
MGGSMSDTPETDHIENNLGNAAHPALSSFCRKLERERDEAIAEETNAVNDIIGVRWKLNSLAEACQNLIDVKGRHNTEIAFNKMKSILESITKQTNEMGRL